MPGEGLSIVVSADTCGWVRGMAKVTFCAFPPGLLRDGENRPASHFNRQWEDRMGDIDSVPAVVRVQERYSATHRVDVSLRRHLIPHTIRIYTLFTRSATASP